MDGTRSSDAIHGLLRMSHDLDGALTKLGKSEHQVLKQRKTLKMRDLLLIIYC